MHGASATELVDPGMNIRSPRSCCGAPMAMSPAPSHATTAVAKRPRITPYACSRSTAGC